MCMYASVYISSVSEVCYIMVVCVYVRMCACVCVCMYVCVHVCVYVCTGM